MDRELFNHFKSDDLAEERCQMKCRSAQKKFSAYQDRELKPLEQEGVGRHLLSCESCRKDYEKLERVWQTAKSYEPKAKFTTWIYRIATNRCLNELKSARRRKWFPFHRSDEDSENAIEETFSDGSPTAEDLLLSRERNRRITEALQSLPENQRMALILKRYDDLSYEEIAGILNCSVSAVESLLVRAKRNLQEKLKNL